jgi:hypothetical protein
VFKLYDRVVGPEPLANLFPSNDLSGMFQEKYKDAE